MTKASPTLTQRTAAGVAWITSFQVARQVLQVISIAILARRVPPAAYGLIAMAFLVTSLLETVRDVGTGAGADSRAPYVRRTRLHRLLDERDAGQRGHPSGDPRCMACGLFLSRAKDCSGPSGPFHLFLPGGHQRRAHGAAEPRHGIQEAGAGADSGRGLRNHRRHYGCAGRRQGLEPGSGNARHSRRHYHWSVDTSSGPGESSSSCATMLAASSLSACIFPDFTSSTTSPAMPTTCWSANFWEASLSASTRWATR